MIQRAQFCISPFPMKKLFRSVTLAAVFISLFSVLSGATWVLTNGDRLTGELLEERDDLVEIEHPALGRITIARSALQGTVTETESVEDVAEAQAAAEFLADLPPGPPASTATPTAPTTPMGAPRFKWLNRQIELGYARQDGARNKEDVTARLQAEARRGSHSFRGTARLIRSETDSQLVINRQEADFRWRHDFSGKLFAQSLTTYAADDIRKINLSLEQQVGGGYRVIDARRQQVNVGIGAVVQRLARDGYDDLTTLLGSAFQDYTLQWNERLRFTQEATVMLAEDGSIAQFGGRSNVATAPTDGNYRVKFNAALQTKMTDNVSLSLRYEYDYDRSVPEPVLRSDSRLTTSLGYAW